MNPHRMPCTALVVAAAFALAGCAGMRPAAAPDVSRLTAVEAAAGICQGTFTSEALTRAYLERAKAHAAHNAFVTLAEASALEAARAADARRASGAACLPLQGVPLVVKDNIHVAGLPSTAGTPALKNFVPATDAPVVQRLRAAGAVILGKTNMHELAFGISGYNPAFNTGSNVGVRNAYDVTRMPGGSSAGSGVAIGLRMAPAALGTDTGGSVRVPCALNGCASLRPTVGRYPQAGIAPISHTRDTAGPMAVAMADVELMDRVITGAPVSGPADLRGVRVGLVGDFLANLDADTQAAFAAALTRVRNAGATVVNVEMPQLGTLNGNVSFPIALYEAYDDMVAYLRDNDTGISIAQLVAQIASPDVKGTYEGLVVPRVLPLPNGGVTPAAPAYQAAMRVNRPALVKLYADTFRDNRLDAIVFPTVPRTAPLANPDSSSLANFLLFIQNTDPGSDAGVPGIQLPMGMGASSGMPIGLELDGPAGSDRRLVAIGMAIEAVLGRVPPAR
ncbi:MAG: indole acetimide hydrolase [Ramlibacter sp.]|nr:indole acetimide hydrolase [Ramlibacter sp.]